MDSCENVNPQCDTWNLANGNCITCFAGYGDDPKNGKAINGECPLFNSSNIPPDPNCKCYTQRGECQ
jgi:hypothetical protein